ncbi:MAG TPA: bifunctional phosphoribosyl-AMP cyclohydrolase/phosphoribosyl-ATP diphosphatase HisIE [Thermoanaerobaculia bacterium]|jgi:phosphoribosyl-ATP pyrophosphohydrolase/phosphoribosyl-AMP cyclohydrolase|nr:bifunctional phosphoribosyl-AMP cyclohydrolase/phosphoribosyl-ATP diphosphatase HisIE [Thermoanaerobaculia bacterium]
MHDANTLTPAIIQDARTGEVLTLAYMNAEALAKTRETGETWLWSRSRNELWHKGATSGNTQHVVAISEDCDNDAFILSVIPNGPACHTGARSCFTGVPPRTLDGLMNVLRDRREKRPEGSYTAKLLTEGRGRIAKKIGEEATEVVIAALSETRERMISEIADLVFHVSVLMADEGVEWADVEGELERRRSK